MSLTTVLGKIKTLEAHANEDVDSGSRDTMAARRGRKSRAIESLKTLRREYSEDLQRAATFVLVIGDKRNEFTAIATENAKWIFSANPEKFYLDLVDRVPSALYLGRESVSNVFDILGRHLEDKMIQLERVSGYPQLIFRQGYQRTIKSRAEFLSLVKQALVEQIGGEIVGIQAINGLTDEAIKRDHTAKFTPVLLPTADEKFALTVATDLERITNKVFVVVAGESLTKISSEEALVVNEITSDSVKKALKTISNKFKKGE